jgi:serine protease Do
LGDSDAMELGDWVMAMGNPLGFEYSATVGIVSGKGRQLPSSNFRDFIQTDAAIYPGNSGGPLYNLAGEVIGINTAVIPDTNLGFAIPINTVKDILPQLLENGRVTRGYLGVTIGDVRELAERPEGTDSGAMVEAVHQGSPAETAGIIRGDAIVAIDGREVAGATELTQIISSLSPGTEVVLTVVREGEREDIEVTLETLPTTLE